jgi:hypothetical protein
MSNEEWMAKAEETMRANGWQPLDPSGICDHIHDLKKQGYTTSYNERLAAYHEVHRIC